MTHTNNPNPFKPDSAFKRLALKYGSCAYIYKDGIVIWERRQLTTKTKSNTYRAEIQIHHVWPCHIDMYSNDFDRFKSDGLKCRRIVVHNPTLLLSGLNRADIHYHNSSENSKRANVSIYTCHLYTNTGQIIKLDVTSIFSSDICAQPNHIDAYSTDNYPDSINDVISQLKNDYENVEIHGKLPEPEPEKLTDR